MLRLIVCIVGCVGMLLLMQCGGPTPSQESVPQENVQESSQESSNLSENTQIQEPSESVAEQVTEKSTESTVSPDSESASETPNSELPTETPGKEPETEPAQESTITDEVSGGTESTEPLVESDTEQNNPTDAAEQNQEESSVTDGSSEPTEPIADGGSSDTSNAENPPSDTPAATANVTGELFSFLQRGTPIVGAEICVLQHPQVTCVKSDSSGKYKLVGIPVGQDIYITITNSSQNLVPTRIAHHQPVNAPDPHYITGLASFAEANLLASAMGTTLDLQKGMIATDTGEQQGTSYTPLAGVSVSLIPQSGNGPYYPTSSGLPNSKPETSPTGVTLWANVTPGTVEISFSHPQKTCAAPPERIRGTTAGRAKLDIVAGWLHLTGAFCQ